MADLLTIALRFLHVFFAMLWVGVITFANFVLFPRLEKMEPHHRRNFFLTYGKAIFHFGEAAGIGTIVFGVILLWRIYGLGILTSGTEAGNLFLIGLLLALSVWLLGLLYFFPRIKKMTAIMEAMPAGPPPPQAAGSPPPPAVAAAIAELQALTKPLPFVGMVGWILLLAALGTMMLGVSLRLP